MNKTLTHGNFSVTFNSPDYAWFEHTTRGEDGGSGGIWIEEKTVVDFDGTAELPLDVVTALKEAGYDFEEFILPEAPKIEATEDETLEEVCPICSGVAYGLGALGRTQHYRCRDCGMEFSR